MLNLGWNPTPGGKGGATYRPQMQSQLARMRPDFNLQSVPASWRSAASRLPSPQMPQPQLQPTSPQIQSLPTFSDEAYPQPRQVQQEHPTLWEATSYAPLPKAPAVPAPLLSTPTQAPKVLQAAAPSLTPMSDEAYPPPMAPAPPAAAPAMQTPPSTPGAKGGALRGAIPTNLGWNIESFRGMPNFF